MATLLLLDFGLVGTLIHGFGTMGEKGEEEGGEQEVGRGVRVGRTLCRCAGAVTITGDSLSAMCGSGYTPFLFCRANCPGVFTFLFLVCALQY